MSNQGKLIEQLFYVYHDTLKKYCMHCFHYQSQYMPYVDDCIQDVFIAALRKEKKLVSHPNPYAWLANACRKQCATILNCTPIVRQCDILITKEVFSMPKGKPQNDIRQNSRRKL